MTGANEIVIYEGVEYLPVKRNGEVGDIVRMQGYIRKVTRRFEDDGYSGVEFDPYYDTIGCVVGWVDGDYSVLEPAEPTPDYTSIIANLAQRVTSLERITGELVRAKSSLESQLRDTQNNVQTFAEQTEANTKDIKFLDDRTFKKPGKPAKSAEEILREISKILERDERQ